MKRIISVILLIALSLLTLISCGDRKYDEEEVKTAARKLIVDSVILNEIFWGEGLPYIEDRNTADGSYYEAEFMYHKNLGFETLDELMELTEKTFSKGQCSVIEETILSSVVVGEETMTLSRYYQKVSLEDNKTPVCIMVNSDCQNLIVGESEYDFDSIKVIGSEKNKVYVTVNVTISLEEYEPQTRTVRIALVEEDDGWKIDTPTYVSYDKTNLINK